MSRLLAMVAAATTTMAQLMPNITYQHTIDLDNGRGIRYNEPKICETTEGVKSYSGFIDLEGGQHMFFWFFESRNDPSTDPVTLWLNGGPGADNTGGLFDEIGPCTIEEDLTTRTRPTSWNELSNLLFISQPVGVGFSHEYLREFDVPVDPDNPEETVPLVQSYTDWRRVNSTETAADEMWRTLQVFYAGLPQMAPDVKSKVFNMGTQSYGGHWGPGVMNKLRTETEAMGDEAPLEIGSLIIINGITDAALQWPSFPEFAAKNTHGVHPDPMVTTLMEANLLANANGCAAKIEACSQLWALSQLSEDSEERTLFAGKLCAEAGNVCRAGVEMPFNAYTGSHNYDVRHNTTGDGPEKSPLPPGRYDEYLNLPEVQEAIGVSWNFTGSVQTEVLAAFDYTGDFARPQMRMALEELLDAGVRVSLWYGDADWVCNWFGGESLSLGLNWTGSEQFASSGYVPLTVDGTHYGDTREYGNMAFTRVFDAGHAAPFYQQDATYAMFERTLKGKDTATGEQNITADYATEGEVKSTYSQLHEKHKRAMVRSAKFRPSVAPAV